MMDPSFQRKSLSRSVRKPQIRSAKTAKSDTRLLDAEQFLLPTYKRQPVVMTHGRGPYVYDAAGKKYLDFLGGIAVNALGHAHTRIVKVIRREAARAIHLSNLYHNAYQGPLARKLAGWSGMDRVFFSNSGEEAPFFGLGKLLSWAHFRRHQRHFHGKVPVAIRACCSRR